MKNALLYATFVLSLLSAYTMNGGFENASTGAVLPQSPAVFETSLQAPISSSANSLTLTANAVRGGGTLSGYNCFTIDEGSAQAEFVCGTVSGTSVTSLSRGVSPSTGTTTIAALQFAHRRGANVKITDFPVIQILRAQANGQDTFPNQIYYDERVLITSGSPTTTLASKYYVDNVAVSGAPDATEATKGIIELATTAEAAAGTSAGGTGARLAIPASMCNSTSSSAILCVITSAAGKISQTFLDIFTTENTWTKSQTFTATTTVAGSNVLSNAFIINGLPYQFPSLQMASSTYWANNGSGRFYAVLPPVIKFDGASPNANTTSSVATTTLATIVIPANYVQNPNSHVEITSVWETNSGGTACWMQIDYGTGTATTTIYAKAQGGFQLNTVKTILVATTTSSVVAESVASPGGLPYGAGSTVISQHQAVTITTSALTYIAFRGRTESGNCTSGVTLDTYYAEVHNK